MSNTAETLWVEKYRPSTISDCILPTHIKSKFSSILESGELPNLLLTGPGGVGKTTVARALCNELGLDYMLINCSEENGIDTLRNKMKQFASSVSLTGSLKCIILDEFDYSNANSVQPALRAFIEEYSSNCRFILTCNFKNRIISPIHSRCTVHDFNIKKSDLPDLAGQFFFRLKNILDNEGITYEDEVIAELIKKHLPDWRRVLNETQSASLSGSIDTSAIVGSNISVKVEDLVGMLKKKDFKNARIWVGENIDTDSTALFRTLYDNASEYMQPESIPELVIILGEYQYKAAFVADAEINTMACLTEIMAVAKWR